MSIVVVNGITELTIFSQSYSMSEYIKLFSSENLCLKIGVCSLCVNWNKLSLNESFASGCSKISLKCLDINYGEKQLGCFYDDKITPSCFVCPNKCSGNGNCDKGICSCKSNWTGDDCSSKNYIFLI